MVLVGADERTNAGSAVGFRVSVLDGCPDGLAVVEGADEYINVGFTVGREVG